MYISLKWVQKLVSINNLSLSLLCEKLTLAGFEIEEIIENKKYNSTDFVLDISLTANRSDLFNVKGFVRELFSIFFNETNFYTSQKATLSSLPTSLFYQKECSVKYSTWENFLQTKYFNQKNKKNSLGFPGCSIFLSIESENFEVRPTPRWIEKSLLFSNIEPKNNILDTINFVGLETGYPFFVYDLDKLKAYYKNESFFFSTRYANSQEKFFIDSNDFILLNTNNLLLDVNDKTISVIGLANLKEIEVDEETTNILIWGGLFDSTKIRKSSQSLGLRTNQSISLEKNLNVNGFEQSFIRLNHLLRVQGISLKNNYSPRIHYFNKINPVSSLQYIQNKRPKLKLRYKEVHSIFGSTKFFEPKYVLTILKALNCTVLEATETYCVLFTPLSRQKDLEREIDIIEEIVRINGFTRFKSSIPNFNQLGSFSNLEKLKRLLQQTLIQMGLNEVLHYSMSTSQGSNQLELKNPIITETNYFRKSLLNQLITKASLNKKQKNEIFEAFEIGQVFLVTQAETIVESELIAGIFGGTKSKRDWNQPLENINWFQAKGLIEHIFEKLQLSVSYSKINSNESIDVLHTNRRAHLLLNNNIVGVFGQIHPLQAKLNNLFEDTYLFEFNIKKIESVWKEQKMYTYNPYSIYPSSSVDLAFIVQNNITYQRVEEKIRELGAPLLESIDLFDFYSGSPIPQGFHSLALKLSFRALDRTLTSIEVNKIVQQVIISLQTDFGITVRE